MLEDFFNSLLSLPSYWVVEQIEHNSMTDEVFIYVKFNVKGYKASPGKEFYGLHDYNSYRTWRHLDILQYKTYIKAKLPRIKDIEGNIKTIKPPWANLSDRSTYLFEKRVIDTLLATKKPD